jgi:hypothetical protein
MSDEGKWPDFATQVVPRRARFIFALNRPSSDPFRDGVDVGVVTMQPGGRFTASGSPAGGAAGGELDGDGDAPARGFYGWIEEDIFEGWLPPVPREGDVITFERGEPIYTGAVRSVDCSYAPDGVTYFIVVDNRGNYDPHTRAALLDDE